MLWHLRTVLIICLFSIFIGITLAATCPSDSCPNGQGCCRGKSGDWACVPSKDSVCCDSNDVTFCSKGEKCVESSGHWKCVVDFPIWAIILIAMGAFTVLVVCCVVYFVCIKRSRKRTHSVSTAMGSIQLNTGDDLSPSTGAQSLLARD
mmetsp:Transcript_9704/g.10657  ORF Transcript_9704/g.10657 Transcript_9704/m.10657 type:complete len:149 (-) Transcript_9704:206-652(-)